MGRGVAGRSGIANVGSAVSVLDISLAGDVGAAVALLFRFFGGSVEFLIFGVGAFLLETGALIV